MTTIGKPKIDQRPKLTYMGIRTIAPFKGMSKEIDRISQELNAWISENKHQNIRSTLFTFPCDRHARLYGHFILFSCPKSAA